MPCLFLKRNAARRMRGPGSSKKRRGYVSNSYLHLLVGLVQYESHKAQTTCLVCIYKLRYEWDTCLLPKGLFRIVCVCISQVTHIFVSRRHPALRSKSNIYCLDSLCPIDVEIAIREGEASGRRVGKRTHAGPAACVEYWH